jgi:3',5'-cyclic AMP phosphodiesterase CpdA
VGRLLAVSDLHVGYADNRAVVDRLRPGDPDDWLIVAGDVAERFADVRRTLAELRDRFGTVLWAPGNHELWTLRDDPVGFRGEERYAALVAMCRELGVLTPEDPYPVWTGPGGPVTVAPLFLLYDYTSLRQAYETGVVCTDEWLLHPDPYPGRDVWCAQRVRSTAARLAGTDPALPTVLVNHFPLVRQPTEVLRYPEFAQWCGTEHTADWHRRFRATVVVYGHLHIPRTTWYDGVRFEEVSLGYPREWRRRGEPALPRVVLPG